MTGFSTTNGDRAGAAWRWDVRSVNSKGLDLRLRVPNGLDALEASLKKRAQARLSRGSVTAALTIERTEQARVSTLNPVALRSAVEAVRIAHDELKLFDLSPSKVDPVSLISMPGVMEPRGAVETEDGDAEAFSEALLLGFEAALDGLCRQREGEGAELGRVIAEQVNQIDSLVRDAAREAEQSVELRAEKLRMQVAGLLTGDQAPAEDRIVQEVAILATKADIREELDRLDAHVTAARGLLASDEPVGRRLEFLTQEFNREANTLCAKASTNALTTIGLELKRIVDQIREQAANVE